MPRDRARPAGAGPGPESALADLGTGWCGGRGRAGAAASADCSAAASCSGRGRDTSLARMAALSVIFIPGIGTLHRYPFQPAVNQSCEHRAKSGRPASLRCAGKPAVRANRRWRGEASRRGVYCAAGDVRPATDRRMSAWPQAVPGGRHRPAAEPWPQAVPGGRHRPAGEAWPQAVPSPGTQKMVGHQGAGSQDKAADSAASAPPRTSVASPARARVPSEVPPR